MKGMIIMPMTENDYTQKLITMTRVNGSGALEIFYPKTVAQNVFIDATTKVSDHVVDTNLHITATERTALTNFNQANGFAKLDSNGFVPTANINPSILAITTEFNNIAGMTAGAANIEEGQLVWVNDASADATVTSGWAIYRKKVGQSIDYTELAGWTKVTEAEMLDVVVSWDSISGKPTSTVAEIDQAVADDHTHANKAQLDLIGFNATTSRPTYNSNDLAYRADVSKVVATAEANASTVVASESLVEGDQVYLIGATVTLA
jgi:hypothetical protein